MKRTTRFFLFLVLGIVLAWSLEGWSSESGSVLPLSQGNLSQGNLSQGNQRIPLGERNPGVWVNQGQQAYEAGRFAEAVEAFNQALSELESQSSPEEEAQVLSLLSLAHQKLGQWQAAQTTLQRGFTLVGLMGRPLPSSEPFSPEVSTGTIAPLPPPTSREMARIQAQLLSAQGQLQFDLGHAEAAWRSWQQAEVLYRRGGFESGVIGSQINQSQALQGLGFYNRAQKQYAELADRLQTLPDSSLKAIGLNNFGNTLRQVADLDQATQVLQAGLAVAQRLELVPQEQQLLLSLGHVQRALAQRARVLKDQDTQKQAVNQALAYYQQVAETASTVSLKVQAQLAQLQVLVEEQQFDRAVTIADPLAQSLPSLPASRTTVDAQVYFVQNLLVLKQWQDDQIDQFGTEITPSPWLTEVAIVTRLNHAIDQAQSLQDLRAESNALGILGKTYAQAQNWRSAQTATQQALIRASEIQAPELAYQWQWQMGRILRGQMRNSSQGQMGNNSQQQRGERSQRQIAENLPSPTGESSQTPPSQTPPSQTPSSQTQLLQTPSSQTQLLQTPPSQTQLLQTPSANSAFSEEQDNSALAYYQAAYRTLQGLRGDLIALNPEVQFSFREQVEPVYREYVDLLLSPEHPSQTALIEARNVIEGLQLAELDNFFQEACVETQTQGIEQIDATAAVFYPILLPNRLAVIVSIPDQPLLFYQTPLTPGRIETVINELLNRLNPVFPAQLGLPTQQRLYNWLIQPAEATLTQHQIQTLVFVLDGALRSVPMAVLHDGQQYLIEKYNLALTPGLQLLPSNLVSITQLKLLAVGLTEARQGFAPLPAVAMELAEIVADAPESRQLLNQEFTQDLFKAQIQDFPAPIVHLATHGQFSSNPDQTFILTWDGKIEARDFQALLQGTTDGEISPIELLVLSACQTASGDDRAALGLAGLAVRSGARSTLATLWSVNDASTGRLMVNFYDGLIHKGLTKVEALRQAQLELLEDANYDRPYYWAPFVLIGNWL